MIIGLAVILTIGLIIGAALLFAETIGLMTDPHPEDEDEE